MRLLIAFLLVVSIWAMRRTQNSQGDRPGRTEEMKQEEDAETDEDVGGGRRLQPRTLYGTKPIYIDKAVNAVEGTDSQQIYDTDVGRPIYREFRECCLSSLNEVGGGLCDFIVQSAIDAAKPLVIVDGFGGRKGYSLELIDTDTGPIRDRIYKIIKASLHTRSLWLPQLKFIYSVETMCMSSFFAELDSIYFRMSPESSLKAQQSFQSLVYLPDFTIQSFFMMFAAFATEWCFFRQFLENGGLPFRLDPREYIAQLRIATTAKTDLFITNWLDFDKAAPERKAAQSEEDRAAKKEVLTYIHISSIMTEMSVTYARALQYLKVPTPSAGAYPTGDESSTNLMVRLAHLHGNGQYFTAGQANAVNGSNNRRTTPAPAPAPSPSPSTRNNTRDKKEQPKRPADFIHPKDIKTPTEITTKSGQKNHIFPLTFTNPEKDEWLGKNLKPPQGKRCRKSTKYDEVKKIYKRCYGDHYTHDHDKLFPDQKNVRMVQLASAGEYANRHPLSEHEDAVSPEEWDHYFPRLPCYGVTTTAAPSAPSTRNILQNIRARKAAAKAILPLPVTPPASEDTQEQSQIFTHAPGFFDDMALFVACFVIFLACTWAFGAFTIFAHSAAVYQVTSNR